jgi:CRP/FNR family transcriptional regulator, cyclic AMP receptor protein
VAQAALHPESFGGNMSENEIRDELSKCPLFSGLSKRGLHALVECAKPAQHPAGKDIVEQGGQPLGFHLITAGSASVLIDDERRRTLVAGDYFGIVSLLDGEPRSATVRADTPLETLFVAPWSFRPLLREQPSIAYELLPALCVLLRSAEGQ